MSANPDRVDTPRGCVEADDGFIGESAPIRQLRSYLRKLAQSSANVFIVGETGTGKERVAQFLHEQSPRRSQPLVCIAGRLR